MNHEDIKLNETADLMTSSDYKDRFRAEFHQLSIRLYKLKKMLDAWDAGELNFTPSCPRSIYDLQMDFMLKYLAVLECRAAIENIELYEKSA